MVTNDNIDINIRFNTVGADLSKVSKDIKVFQSGVDSAKGSVDGFDRVIQKFSVQTFAQGLLNISTSAAQVYTSFSNLDRAANQVQASLVAMHKAEDQIERKQIQLTKAIDQYGISSEKAAMINEELATAEEQLAVKTERHRLAVDQLRDTQILMVSNLVNTGFGALQTITSLHNMLTSSLKNNTIQTGVNTAAKVLSGAATTGSAAGLVTATAAQAANNVQTTLAIPLHIAFANAVRSNPLFLPATLATIGIGIAATAYTVSQMAQSTKDLTESVNGSSGAIDGLTGSYDSNLPSANSFGSSVSNNTTLMEDFTEKINEMNSKIIDNNKILSQNTIADKKFKGRYASGLSDEETKKLTDENEKTARNIAFENQKMIAQLRRDVLVENTKTGALSKSELITYGLLTAEDLREQSSIVSNAIKDITDLTKDGLISEALAMKKTINLWDDKSIAVGMSKKELEEAIKAQMKLNEVEEKGSKNQIKYLKEIAELKKKTSPRYIGELGKSLGLNLKDGTFGLSDPMLEYLTGKTSSELGYIPFQGIFDKQLKNIKQNIALAITSNQLFGQTGLLEEMYSILPALVPGSSEYKQVTDAINQVHRNIDSISKSPSVSHSVGSEKLAAYSSYLRKLGFIGGGSKATGDVGSFSGVTIGEFFRKNARVFSNIAIIAGKPVKIGDKNAGVFRNIGGGVGSLMGKALNASSITGQQASKPGEVLKILGLSQTSTAKYTSAKSLAASLSVSVLGSRGKGLTTAKGKGKSAKHGGANRNDEYQAQKKYSGIPEQYGELSILTGIPINLTVSRPSGKGWSGRATYHFDDLNKRLAEINARVSLRDQIMGLGSFDPDIISADLYKIPSEQLAVILQREQSQIEEQRIKIGATAAEVTSLRGSYVGHDELLDRVRFVDKLAQISTGATIF